MVHVGLFMRGSLDSYGPCFLRNTALHPGVGVMLLSPAHLGGWCGQDSQSLLCGDTDLSETGWLCCGRAAVQGSIPPFAGAVMHRDLPHLLLTSSKILCMEIHLHFSDYACQHNIVPSTCLQQATVSACILDCCSGLLQGTGRGMEGGGGSTMARQPDRDPHHTGAESRAQGLSRDLSF